MKLWSYNSHGWLDSVFWCFFVGFHHLVNQVYARIKRGICEEVLANEVNHARRNKPVQLLYQT
jgi:hypothetical protein